MAAAPYEITANAQNSDALGRVGGSLLENRRYETVSCVERKQCGVGRVRGKLDFVPVKNIELTRAEDHNTLKT